MTGFHARGCHDDSHIAIWTNSFTFQSRNRDISAVTSGWVSVAGHVRECEDFFGRGNDSRVVKFIVALGDLCAWTRAELTLERPP